ncbi:MAG: protein-disulfide reductase DsbD domain-containing protein [Planctomycetota bacterium]
MTTSLLSVLLAAAAAPATAAQFEQTPDGSKLVRIEALADQDGVRAGERVRVLVHFAIERGWHTYWANAGDSGLPTKLAVKAPDGFEVGPQRFSTPMRHELPGEIVDYVHENEQIVWFELTAPKNAAPGIAKLTIEARWLVCIDVCLPGSGETELEIPIFAEGRAPKAIESDTLKRWRALLPRPASALQGLTARWTPGDELALELSVAGAHDLEWFPYRDDRLHMTARTTNDARLRAQFEIEAGDGAAPRVARGVLRVRTDKLTHAYELEFPLPDGAREH